MNAVIFDLDGVIVLSEPVHLKSFNMVLEKKYNIKNALTMNDWKAKYIGRGSEYIWNDLGKKYGFDTNDGDAFKKERHEMYKRIAKKELKLTPGFHKFLSFLESQNIKVMIASNGNIDNVLTEVKLAHIMHIPRLNKDKVANPKPAPDIYQLAMEELDVGAVFVIEDSVAGIIAAKSAGAKVIALSTTQEPNDLITAGADYVFKDFNDIMKHKELFI